ncbi:hypothetical protein, partial [Streptomyces lydicus]|uniref:hypothetical protein n=1 Tax=Streptomyces lydicus TaxID=47763 RepID=UPI003316C0C6
LNQVTTSEFPHGTRLASHDLALDDSNALRVKRGSGAARPPYGGSSATSWPTPRAWCAPPT